MWIRITLSSGAENSSENIQYIINGYMKMLLHRWYRLDFTYCLLGFI